MDLAGFRLRHVMFELNSEFQILLGLLGLSDELDIESPLWRCFDFLEIHTSSLNHCHSCY